jgi:hypothetical protein
MKRQKLVENAAKRVTQDYARRWKRIKSNPIGEELFHEVVRLSEQIPNAQLAVDIFEHVAAIRREQVPGKAPGKPPRKRAVAHDSALDLALLEMFNESNPKSPLSLAAKGLLPNGDGQFYRPMNEREFAKLFIGKSWAFRRRWPAKSAAQILRRVRDLRKAYPTTK